MIHEFHRHKKAETHFLGTQARKGRAQCGLVLGQNRTQQQQLTIVAGDQLFEVFRVRTDREPRAARFVIAAQPNARVERQHTLGVGQ